MANSFKGQVPVTHDGKTYTMALDFNALCDFEDQTGKNALQALDGMESGEVSARDMRALMWAGLKQFHPDMTLPLAGHILAENINAIAEAAALMMPQEGDGGNVPAPKPGRKTTRAKTGTRP
ncbi:GTA-gp10 family protein [Falsirhodobacter halotolerans]|uniref:GTA-gp10 family protein n=1 Tax=Falsirhodobacter halotolerans TaxID=1146892 RepID=UPI001FD48790|nr:GTA-gp10 family protein [Falsirhodobacter halotolerans]MCJ8139354.1 gene transfer agent family protein [Falsirhodobacter halotolerans]